MELYTTPITIINLPVKLLQKIFTFLYDQLDIICTAFSCKLFYEERNNLFTVDPKDLLDQSKNVFIDYTFFYKSFQQIYEKAFQLKTDRIINVPLEFESFEMKPVEIPSYFNHVEFYDPKYPLLHYKELISQPTINRMTIIPSFKHSPLLYEPYCIPDNIKHIDIIGKMTLREIAVNFFPPNLETLELNSIEINPEIFKAIKYPSNLKTLVLHSEYDCPHYMPEKLPPKLEELSVYPEMLSIRSKLDLPNTLHTLGNLLQCDVHLLKKLNVLTNLTIQMDPPFLDKAETLMPGDIPPTVEKLTIHLHAQHVTESRRGYQIKRVVPRSVVKLTLVLRNSSELPFEITRMLDYPLNAKLRERTPMKKLNIISPKMVAKRGSIPYGVEHLGAPFNQPFTSEWLPPTVYEITIHLCDRNFDTWKGVPKSITRLNVTEICAGSVDPPVYFLEHIKCVKVIGATRSFRYRNLGDEYYAALITDKGKSRFLGGVVHLSKIEDFMDDNEIEFLNDDKVVLKKNKNKPKHQFNPIHK